MSEDNQLRWEYKVITLDAEQLKGDAPGLELLEISLNELGAGAWEMISVLPMGDGSQGASAIFKRPRVGSMW